MEKQKIIPKRVRKHRWQHASYVAVAKTRAKVLKVFSHIITIRRPMLFVGASACHELCDMLINEGYRTVFIVTDAQLNALGIPAAITAYLSEKDICYHVYEGVTPDPTFCVIEEGLRQSRAAKCDAIIAIGGGSVIDAAKMMAMSQGNDCQPQQLIGLFKAKKAATPLYCVPTTAGTGSEATLGAVVSDDKTHQKSLSIDPKMVPLAAAIDPVIMKGMPAHITADTGIDVLTHALEAWMSVNASVETDYYAASAVKSVMHYLPIAYQDGSDLKAREAMGVAAHYGGIAFNKAGLGYVHAIAHQLGAYYRLPHGRANAIVLPYVLEANRHVSQHRLAALAKKIGLVGTEQAGSSDEAITDHLLAQVHQLIADLNIDPTVKGLQTCNFDRIAHAAAKEVSDTYAVPLYLSISDIKDILHRIKQACDEHKSEQPIRAEVG